MPIKFIFLVLPNVHLLDLAGPDQAIHEAIDFGANFTMEYCGLDENIKTSAGLDLDKPKYFSTIVCNEGDFIVVPGAKVSYLLSDEFKKNKELFAWLRTAHQQKVNLVSICAGAFVLAEASLLNGISSTTHFKLTTQLQNIYPQTKVKENILYVEENNIYTSAGIASGIDLMLFIIEKLTDSYFAHKVARELVIYNRRDGASLQENAYLQFRNHLHAGIHKAQDFIIENTHLKKKLSELAEIACMSERNFTRIFKKQTNCTVNEYITAIRLEKIKTLIQNPALSRKQIALLVGLESEKQLQRLLKK